MTKGHLEGVSHPAARRSLRVLIVGDEQEAADSLCGTVSSWGHDVRWASDGAAGLEAAAAHEPEVVLLSVVLSEMDGFSLAQQLRRDHRLKGCFLIAMRALAEKRRSPQCSEADIDLFLGKPLDLSVLETVLSLESDRVERLRAGRSRPAARPKETTDFV